MKKVDHTISKTHDNEEFKSVLKSYRIIKFIVTIDK